VSVPTTSKGWHKLIRRTGLSTGEKAVLLELLYHVDFETGEGAYPAATTIAEGASLGERFVRASLGKLTELGAIEDTAPAGPGRGTTYRLCVDGLLRLVDEASTGQKIRREERMAADAQRQRERRARRAACSEPNVHDLTTGTEAVVHDLSARTPDAATGVHDLTAPPSMHSDPDVPALRSVDQSLPIHLTNPEPDKTGQNTNGAVAGAPVRLLKNDPIGASIDSGGARDAQDAVSRATRQPMVPFTDEKGRTTVYAPPGWKRK
jgi:hypothetical protein